MGGEARETHEVGTIRKDESKVEGKKRQKERTEKKREKGEGGALNRLYRMSEQGARM